MKSTRPALAKRPATCAWGQLLIAGWFLMMPPLPLGTELPPLSQWSPLSQYKTSADCEHDRQAVRDQASQMLTANPSANSFELAGALNRMQVTCIERETPKPVAKPAVEAPKVVTPPPAGAVVVVPPEVERLHTTDGH